jgi:phthiocerol/phenolphthiocerol synthesis type-I polyketide synthase C
VLASSAGRADIAIIGRSCRLPGAANLSALWSLLSEARCAVSNIPEDRWSHDRFFHPRRFEPGKSYTWSAGVLDDIWGFDPGVFGISPREAEQMDPQQRLLLELAWEALEDAGLPPSRFSGKEVGVFIGASALDYGNRALFDMAVGNAHFATGNTLSLISNRISYIFDLRGPSLTIDTACSSSLVALHEAVTAIQSGRIDTAIVGGVNILASPAAFISFSQASMLSPTGLCRAFDAKADGYVRAEGGVVLVLRSLHAASADNNRIFGLVVGSAVNSDGRTVGVSMPSSAAQADLLRRVYEAADISPNAVAFVEAHGTGTRVGDPAEAAAIGDALGRVRTHPLPIGSIKTNVGHLEPAAGLAGLLKAQLALQHDSLPPSLHFDEPNPDISFAEYNIAVCSKNLPLGRTSERRYAGVNSFGFGGTNAHIILSDAPQIPVLEHRDIKGEQLFLISAHCRDALVALASDYAAQLGNASDEIAGFTVPAAGHRREHLSNRLAIASRSRVDVTAALRGFGEGQTDHPDILCGVAVERDAAPTFVYSGNGSQWPGMGRSAYFENEIFSAKFDEADRRFAKYAGWSLKAAIFDDDIERRLRLTSVAQPLIFAIQYAATEALNGLGLKPVAVLGHSVGEVAAAQAAGILSLDDALKVIHFRSRHQELARDRGRMAVVLAERPVAERLMQEIGGLEVAAINSPRALTISGSRQAITLLLAAAERNGVAIRSLDLDYPFHSHLMDVVEKPLLEDLQGISPQLGTIPMVSTVTGACIEGHELGARYWWQNVREPVQFDSAVRNAAALGGRIFIEIGPRATMLSHLNNTLEQLSIPFAALAVLDRKTENDDPIRRAAADIWTHGGRVDVSALVGRNPQRRIDLPGYPWQRKSFRLASTVEALPIMSSERPHPLIGTRTTGDAIEWRGHLDPAILPQLNDHQIDGQILLPGSAFVEMALATSREWLGAVAASVVGLELFQPMIFAEATCREISVRVSPGNGTLEILSRQRLSKAPWQLHATGKIVRHVPPFEPPTMWDQPASSTLSADEVYARAADVGLQFGPSFRQLDSVTRFGSSKIAVALTESPAMARFGIDPARLDSCFHGLIVLFSDLNVRRKLAFVPVRFGDIRLFKPAIAPTCALIEVQHCDDRSISADFTLLDEHAQVVAVLRETRFRAVRAKRVSNLSACMLVQKSALATAPYNEAPILPVSVTQIVEWIQTASAPAPSEDNSDGALLLEGWATAAAMSLVSALADSKGEIDLNALIDSAGLPESVRPWLSSLLSWLEARNLVFWTEATWRTVPDVDLAKPAAILITLAAEHPERSWEILLASRLTQLIERAKSDQQIVGNIALPRFLLDACELRGRWSDAARTFLAKLLQNLEPFWSKKCAIRMLQVGFDPLSHELAAFAKTHAASFTILEHDQQRREHMALAFDGTVEVCDQLSAMQTEGFDLIILGGSLHRWPSSDALVSELSGALSPDGILLAAEPTPSLFSDLVFGADPSWFASGMPSDFPVGRLQGADGWKRVFGSAGLKSAVVRSVKIGAETATIVVATKDRKSELVSSAERQSILIWAGRDLKSAEIAGRLEGLLAADDVSVQLQSTENLLQALDTSPHCAIYIGDCFKSGGPPLEALAERCMGLKTIVEHLGPRQTTMWVVTSGALAVERDDTEPIETGYWAFARTVANEFPNLHMKRVDLSPRLPAEDAAVRIRNLVMCGGGETEVHVGPDMTRVLRIERPDSRQENGHGFPSSARLERGLHGSLDSLSWSAIERSAPAAGEIEIAVEATGLNFRDVMWAMSILPDEALEDGFSGPCLGLECAGRVLQVGNGVEGLKPGDRVIALARSAFATHVVVPSWAATLAPRHLSAAAAATIPVAFATAYYALVTLAQIRRDEWVLIHGGAGGVGLAALQIAQWRGARVIATAGSMEKRDLLKTMGADYVFDSRNTNFVDDVRDITRDGVDVILNSLSGEAMERGISALRPFGRFLELGKRDYMSNTQVGLRPFRRNLTYYGIDLDQLLLDRPVVGSEIFRKCTSLLEKGVLHPLPYSCFSAHEVVDAFRLMQQSGHIGKIVVTPPTVGIAEFKSAREFVVDPEKTHLITGAFSGFGLEAARWLAHRGARHIVMLGRRGPSNPEGQALLAELNGIGVVTRAEACDVSDMNALGYLFKTISSELPPLAGVIHAAMVLEDATIANLNRAQLENVLRPKVVGAENLDRLTRGLDLDYFVLFSSAATFIGNPGQGSYVAANAYMEGLARRRRQLGLPAHAIAWGAIDDAGVLARKHAVRESLASRIGVKGMAAQQALDLMADALGKPASSPHDAVLAIAPVDWSMARGRLPILNSPTYAALGRAQGGPERPEATAIDLRMLIQSDGIEKAREEVLKIIVEEVSRVLRMPKEHVNLVRSLSDVGLDSLMAMELAANLRERVGADAPLSATAGGLTVADLGQQILSLAGGVSVEHIVSASGEIPANENIGDVKARTLSETLHKHGERQGVSSQ